MKALRDDESFFSALAVDPAYRSWLTEVRLEIGRLGDPAEVLAELQDIDNRHARLTKAFPTGTVMEQAETALGPVDVPPSDARAL